MSFRLELTGVLFVILAAVVGFGTVGDEATSPTYQVTAVKGKLLRELPEPEERLQPGATPGGGEMLRTGWRSSAEISSPEHGARFSLGSRTRVRLATDQPGVLLEVERGRLRALFDRLEGDERPERLVTTPSAVLAVRGTDYGVAVASSGDTSVVVFSGEVEIVDLARTGPPVIVRADQHCTIPRGKLPGQPAPHRMGPGDWDRGRMPAATTGSGHGSGGQGGSQGSTGGTSGRSGSGAGGSGQSHGGASKGRGR